MTDYINEGMFIGKRVPGDLLASTMDEKINLSSLRGITIVYAYPRTSPPTSPPIPGWDLIPGARGCTLQSRGFASHYTSIIAAGASEVYGLSTQVSAYQKEAQIRLRLPFDLLSDHDAKFSHNLGLPTFEVEGMTLLHRVTLVLKDGIVRKIFYPVKNPADNAGLVAQYLMSDI